MAAQGDTRQDRDKSAFALVDGKWHRRVVVTSGGTDVDQTCRIDDQGATIYCGTADTGTATSAAAWRIKRVTESGTETVTEWADGDSNFDNIWDNRAALSYS